MSLQTLAEQSILAYDGLLLIGVALLLAFSSAIYLIFVVDVQRDHRISAEEP